ncbi:MAG: hypothetical protein M3450_17270 [Actinomycetota bacterium]|nr:hypothetical protein [Actinomycetota bacterium]MDQ3643160.1 hypothetical protein [Actinomycetota bacterium]
MTFRRLVELLLDAAALYRADPAAPPTDEPRPDPCDHRNRAANNQRRPCRSTRSYGPRPDFR